MKWRSSVNDFNMTVTAPQVNTSCKPTNDMRSLIYHNQSHPNHRPLHIYLFRRRCDVVFYFPLHFYIDIPRLNRRQKSLSHDVRCCCYRLNVTWDCSGVHMGLEPIRNTDTHRPGRLVVWNVGEAVFMPCLFVFGTFAAQISTMGYLYGGLLDLNGK